MTNVQPITLLEINLRIDFECGSDAQHQIMWDQQARGIKTCRNAGILNANILNEHIYLVLRIGGIGKVLRFERVKFGLSKISVVGIRFFGI